MTRILSIFGILMFVLLPFYGQKVNVRKEDKILQEICSLLSTGTGSIQFCKIEKIDGSMFQKVLSLKFSDHVILLFSAPYKEDEKDMITCIAAGISCISKNNLQEIVVHKQCKLLDEQLKRTKAKILASMN